MARFSYSSFALVFALSASASSSAKASELCDWYRSHESYYYNLFCTDGSGEAKPAGANSSFADSFHINSASLPTEPSSYGFESIGSYLRSDVSKLGGDFALIKGFHRFGTGISTSSNDTFYGDDVVERLGGPPNVTAFKPSESAQGHFTNLNLGTSFLLYDPTDGPRVRLGVTVRYNNITNTWGWGPALMVSWGPFSVGAGYTDERISNSLPMLLFENFLVSAHFSIFDLEYNLLINNVDSVLDLPSNYQLSPIHILTLSAKEGRITLTGAVRFLNYLAAGNVVQTHIALQYLFNSHFSAGVLYNYIPGANSLGTQIFL
jgi:hypothetical protein